jgi:hypothetical protein
MPDWFKVGAKVWFMGFGDVVEVISIQEDTIDDGDAFWFGKSSEYTAKYPLDEIDLGYWYNHHVDWNSDTK